MAEIINLRTRRKAKARVEKEKPAEANRLFFGRSSAEKAQAKKTSDLETRRLDGHHLNNPSDKTNNGQ